MVFPAVSFNAMPIGKPAPFLPRLPSTIRTLHPQSPSKTSRRITAALENSFPPAHPNLLKHKEATICRIHMNPTLLHHLYPTLLKNTVQNKTLSYWTCMIAVQVKRVSTRPVSELNCNKQALYDGHTGLTGPCLTFIQVCLAVVNPLPR